MPESPGSVEAMPKKRKGDTGESIPVHPNKTAMLLKPCDSMLLKQCDTLSRKISEEEQPPPPMEITEAEPEVISIKRGKHIDLKSFLSSKDRDYLVSPLNGEKYPISCLDGNYVLVCPFLLPYCEDSFTANTCQSLQSLYSELTCLAFHPIVKLVVVLNLDPSLPYSAFHSFFTRLSLDCLAVPFSDSVSSHRICLSLGLFPNPPTYTNLDHLAVHPNGIVLRRGPSFLNKYGPVSFPFTDAHFLDVDRLDTLIKFKLRCSEYHLTLKGLLKCNQLSRIANDSDTVQVSALAKTTIGLYLFIDGYSMDFIQDIHKKCILQGHNFEILLVPLPFERHGDPPVFTNLVKKSTLENSNSPSSSWLVYPFNDKICRALWRLVQCSEEDQLIILPPGNCAGDVYGKQVAFRYGFDAYPFTRNVIVEKKFTELRSFTIESLLGDIMPDLDLHNKNVVLYIDNPKSYYGSRDYDEIMANYPGTVVIFTSLVSGVGNFQDIKWSILPREVYYDVFDRIFPEPSSTFDEPTLVTFGKDGKILSRQAQLDLPRRSTSSASLFDDKLRLEIEYYLTCEMMEESCEEK